MRKTRDTSGKTLSPASVHRKNRSKRLKEDLSKQIPEDFLSPLDYNTESTVETSGAHCRTRIHKCSKAYLVDDPEGFHAVSAEKSRLCAKLPNEGHGHNPYYNPRNYFRKVKGKYISKKEEYKWSKKYKERILAYKRDVLDPERNQQKAHCKAEEHTNKFGKKHAGYNDVFALNNILCTSTVRQIQIPEVQRTIQVPKFRVLAKSFYFNKGTSHDADVESLDAKNRSKSEEDDSDEKYEEIHSPCEVREKQDKPPLE